jgi:hypothetical protein
MAEAPSKYPRQPQAWYYGPEGWSVVDNPLDGSDPGESHADALRRAGYARQPSMRLEGGRQWMSDYHLEVFDGREFDHFLVVMTTRGNRYLVLVEGFPQLLDLLDRLLPLVKMGAETQDKELALRQQGEALEGLT